MSRFTYSAPGWFRMVGILIATRDRSRFEELIRPWITDHDLGERYRLDADEDTMLEVLAENVRQLKSHPVAKLDYTEEGFLRVRDLVLQAISDRRHGDPRRWNHLALLTPDEWMAMLQGLAAETDPLTPPAAYRASQGHH